MKTVIAIFSLIVASAFFVYCTKKDQVVASSSANSNELDAYKTSVAPTIDGQVDGIWSNAKKLSVNPTVPDPGNGLFSGYIGQQYPATIRSMYDDQYIYFLVEFADATQSTIVAPWYFDPTTKLWAKEPSSKSSDVNGALVRDGWGEDKLAFLWNIDHSTAKFVTQTCYASCHVFSPYMDYSKNVYTSNANNGNHYTNGSTEKIDMWWGRLGFMSKDASLQQMDDNYQDWAGGPAVTNLTGGAANGRHVDGIYVDTAKTYFWPYGPHYTSSPTQGEVNNSQTLKLDGTGASVSVPQWVIPGASANGFILSTETTSGTAKKVTAVSSSGILTLSDGSTINPTTSTDYQRTGDAVYGPTAAKAIPGYIAYPLIGGRADIAAVAVYNGSGWVVEIKRKLKTDDILKQDIDFSALGDQEFGMAIWNKSNNQHGINPNLLLHFQK